MRSDRKSVEYTLYDDGVNPDSKEKGPLRRELLHVNFINSLRNRNPGAMEVHQTHPPWRPLPEVQCRPNVHVHGGNVVPSPTGDRAIGGC